MIKKLLNKEITTSSEQSQEMNVVTNEQLKKRIDLLETTVQKLSSMENLYDKIHSKNKEQKRRIITLVQEPVKKSIEPIQRMMEPIANTAAIANANAIPTTNSIEPKPTTKKCTVKKDIIKISDTMDLAGALLINSNPDSDAQKKDKKKKDKAKKKAKREAEKYRKSLEQCVKNKTAKMIFVGDEEDKK